MKLAPSALALAWVTAATGFYLAAERSLRGPDEGEFPAHNRESLEALAHWDRYGCDEGEGCARFEHWARSRFYFTCEGGADVAE